MGFNQATYYIKLSIAKQKEIEAREGGPDAKSSHKVHHYGELGQCLCMCGRCFSSKSGCICKTCSGAGHWSCPHAENLGKNPGRVLTGAGLTG